MLNAGSFIPSIASYGGANSLPYRPRTNKGAFALDAPTAIAADYMNIQQTLKLLDLWVIYIQISLGQVWGINRVGGADSARSN